MGLPRNWLSTSQSLSDDSIRAIIDIHSILRIRIFMYIHMNIFVVYPLSLLWLLRQWIIYYTMTFAHFSCHVCHGCHRVLVEVGSWHYVRRKLRSTLTKLFLATSLAEHMLLVMPAVRVPLMHTLYIMYFCVSRNHSQIHQNYIRVYSTRNAFIHANLIHATNETSKALGKLICGSAWSLPPDNYNCLPFRKKTDLWCQTSVNWLKTAHLE